MVILLNSLPRGNKSFGGYFSSMKDNPEGSDSGYHRKGC